MDGGRKNVRFKRKTNRISKTAKNTATVAINY